jgi:site-specific recombinase XerD
MIEQYVQHMIRRRRSPNTIRLRLFYLRKFKAWFGKNLAAAQHDDFESYIFADREWSENTQQTATASLRSFYGWAWREGLITQNPARDLPSIKVHRRTPRIASETAIRDAIQCDSLADRAMVMLGAECGLRVSEIANLNIKDRDGEWLHVIGKGNNMRTLHMTPELCEMLDTIEATTMRHGHYFPGRSGIYPMHPSTVWRHITVILKSNPHSLRRRAGTVVY